MKFWYILFLISVFFAGILSFNFLNSCSSYGGVVGKINSCKCFGAEISHPLNYFEKRPGFSSTMCIGFQQPNVEPSVSHLGDPRCQEKIITGPCRASIPAYQYNPATNTCEEGVYGGCEGNVPFKSSMECLGACLKLH